LGTRGVGLLQGSRQARIASGRIVIESTGEDL
jgi:hypothetical protein